VIFFSSLLFLLPFLFSKNTTATIRFLRLNSTKETHKLRMLTSSTTHIKTERERSSHIITVAHTHTTAQTAFFSLSTNRVRAKH
jgi:hypothetical protein